MPNNEIDQLLTKFQGSVSFEKGAIQVHDEKMVRLNIESLVRISALGEKSEASGARYLLRLIALELGAIPASIHELYLARGKGDVPPNFTVPAMNLRMLSFDAAKAVFRAAKKIDAGAFIFEIARSRYLEVQCFF